MTSGDALRIAAFSTRPRLAKLTVTDDDAIMLSSNPIAPNVPGPDVRELRSDGAGCDAEGRAG
ncbi:ring-hydroxylating dioxygenase [Anopheles sinensis]|uniref:Ring-hydroxylating dioxygenase n=1 Tax=Anopheles sinensis TaxID=74873 RepID=A0A084WRM5_ANOSI|nr:ring-hydroxylating dioxygenase [Anopheles sinensis]